MVRPLIRNMVLYFLLRYLIFYAGNIVYQRSYKWLDLSTLKTGADVFEVVWSSWIVLGCGWGRI